MQPRTYPNYFAKGGISLGRSTKKTVSFLFVFLSVWFSIRYLLPLVFPFLLGTALALTAEPAVSFFCRSTRMPRPLSAGLGVTVTFVSLGILLLLVCAFLVRELSVLAGIMPNLEDTAMSGLSLLQSWLLGLTGYAPDSIQPLLQQNITELFSGGTALLDRAMRYVLTFAGDLLTHVPDSALSLGTAAIAGYMISAKLPKIKHWITVHWPAEKLRPILAALKRMKAAVFGWILAQLKLAGVTLTILMLGFLILRIPYGPLWALAVSLIDAFPVLGTGTVLLPWALISFLQNDIARAVGLAGIYTVITLIRSVLEPKLVGKQLGLDPLVALMALYAGYKLWGIGGMILAPLLTVTAFQLAPEKKER